MSVPADKSEQLEALVAVLCEGEITPDEAARLEELACESGPARRYLLDYVQLHGELYWQYAAAAREAAPEPGAEQAQPVARAAPSLAARLVRAPLGWLAHATAASLVLTTLGAGALAVVLALWIVPLLQGPGGAPAGPDAVAVARLARTFGAEWSEAQAVPTDGEELAAGTTLDLREGLAEIAFNSGARALLQGPARLEIAGDGEARLHVGSLYATVPKGAAGFRVRTPEAAIVDRGTEFGVAVDASGASEVHVFVGSVDILPDSPVAAGGTPHGVHAGQAVRVWTPVAGTPARVEALQPGSRSFVRAIPAAESLPGSVAALRELVAAHPRLIHHYTFEGTSPAERRQDRRGSLHLVEAVMSGGRGGGDLAYRRGVLDAANTVVQPRRGSLSGNTTGVGLQSDGLFQPPARMTVELLVCFTGFEAMDEGTVGAAVATRAGARDCGFLAVAVDTGQIAYLLDGDAPWGGSTSSLIPGEWYYLAATFQAESGKTKVNVYLANLTRGEKTLKWAVQDEPAPGTPAASRLGIGKGFDRNVAHAYPWPGLLDEVAVFDTVLDRHSLQQHLDALLTPRSGKP